MKKKFLLFLLPLLLIVQPVQAEEADIREEIFYDIIIDRFNIGDHNFGDQVKQDDPLAYHGGDLVGITNKLDRIAELGFTAIIISPFQQNAPDGYHGYWIEDFYEVNELYGSVDDLQELIAEAHKRDIKVIAEFVINYLSKSHPFVSESDKQDWFKANDVQQTDATFWLEDVEMLDQDQEEVAQYLTDVATHWIQEVGFDGYKLHDADQASRTFIEDLTTTLKETDPSFYILAGVSDQPETLKSSFLKEIPTLDGVENHELFEQLNDVFTNIEQPVSQLYEQINENTEGPQDILFIDNKNSARFANNFSDRGREKIQTWELAFTYLYTRPGIPVILQGSELPMYGPSFEESQHLVRFNATTPDIEEFLNRITSLRKEFKSLTHGDFDVVGSEGAMTVIKRTYENETMYIAINNDSKSHSFVLPDIDPELELIGFLGDDLVRENSNGEFKISVPRESVEVYFMRPHTGLNWILIIPISLVMLTFIGAMIYLSIKERRRAKE